MAQDNKKTEMIRYSFFYTLSHYAAQFINFFTAVMMRKFLGPFYMGIWNLLKVITGYGMFADFGSQTTITYKIPYLKGKGEFQKIEEMTNSVFNFTTLATAMGSFATLVYAIIFKASLSPEVFVGLLVVSVLLIVQRVYTYYIVLLRANKDFSILNRSMIFDAVLNIILVFFLVRTLKLYGLFVVILLLPALNVWYIRFYKTYNIKFTWKTPDILSHIKFGFPLFLANILNYMLHNIDTIMIAAMLGFEQVGFYSIALMSKSYTEDISKLFSHIAIPYLLEDYGRTEDVRKVSKYVTQLTLITSYITAVMLSLVFIFAPPFVTYVLPQFTTGISALKAFLLAIFFSGIAIFSFNYIVALNKQTWLLPVVALTIGANIILNYVFIVAGFGITGVAFASSISAFLFFCILLVYAMKHFAGIKEITVFFIRTLFPLLYCIAILLVLEHQLNSTNIILGSLIKVAIFVLSILPIAYILNKQTQIVTFIWQQLFKRFKKAV